jgi:isopentenyl-diphosphate delta-isomerase
MRPQSTPDRDQIVLLDPATDAPVGSMEKFAAHVEGRYHAAISVLLVDPTGRHILQQRAATKYHAPGLWSNACCSHPFPGENGETAAVRRLEEELGIDCTPRRFGTVRYRSLVAAPTGVGGTMIEHERGELFCAVYSGDIQPNRHEVSAVRSDFIRQADTGDADFTPWFKLYLKLFGREIEAFTEKTEITDFGFHDLIAFP